MMNRLIDYRPCYVRMGNGEWKKGMFHGWGINNGTVGIVEDTKGRVRYVYPGRIRFADDPGFDEWAWDDEEERDPIPKMYDDDDDDIIVNMPE